MSTQAFGSTPAFELFRRALTTQSVQRFHGINVHLAYPLVPPEHALDCLNVIVSSSGGLSKFRLPVNLMNPLLGVAGGAVQSFWDFQQANGKRMVVVPYTNGTVAVWGSAGSQLFQTVYTLVPAADATNIGQWSMVSGVNNLIFAANGQKMVYQDGNIHSWIAWGVLSPGTPTVVVVSGGQSPVFGYQYSTAWRDNDHGYVGNIGPLSASTGPQTNKAFQVTANPINQPISSSANLIFFRNLDGGGDQFRLCEVNTSTGALTTFGTGANITVLPGNLGIQDNSPDTALDQTTRGPLINTPPLVGKYLAVGQNRIAVMNLVGAPQDIIYSGFEQIFLGRPESSFPPFNRLRLAIGADQIAGGAFIQAGLVAFSQTSRMYMLRGLLEDIVTTQPVAFSAYLEELPWTLGCFSHFTIQSTPYGLVWLAADKTVQFFDGRAAPVDISRAIYPYLQQITPGTENQATSAYFNWLERDWYVLVVAVQGSLTPNRTFYFSLDPETSKIEVFISDIPTAWIGLLTTPTLQRILCVTDQLATGLQIQQLPISADTINGITNDDTIIPPTSGILNAYWRSGYFGNEQPQRSKLFRWQTIVADPAPPSFSSTVRLVNDRELTFQQPGIIGPFQYEDGTQEINQRAKRCSVEINFPNADAPANVIELQVAQISTSDRKG